MKQFLAYISFLFVVAQFQFATCPKDYKTIFASYYISASGDDGTGDGSIGNPWKTFGYGADQLNPGDILYARGGTYRSANALTYYARHEISDCDGNSGSHVTIRNYPGETVVINVDDQVPTVDNFGLVIVGCSYLDIYGIRVTAMTQDVGNNALSGISIQNSDHVTLNWCIADNIEGNGFTQIYADDITYNDCDAHSNGDVQNNYEGSNGFDATATVNTSTNITYNRCRAWWNSDDGWDFFNLGGIVTLNNCWSFWNGYIKNTFTHAGSGDGNGFKLGPGNGNTTTIIRYLNNCLAFENYQNGFDENYNSSHKYPARLYNCTAFSNDYGFLFLNSDRTHIFTNCSSVNNTTSQYLINAESTVTTCSWSGVVTLTTDDYVRTSSTGMDGARNPDHTLPKLLFLRLKTNSDLVDAGTNVSLGHQGAAPDINWEESPLQKPKTIRR